MQSRNFKERKNQEKRVLRICKQQLNFEEFIQDKNLFIRINYNT